MRRSQFRKLLFAASVFSISSCLTGSVLGQFITVAQTSPALPDNTIGATGAANDASADDGVIDENTPKSSLPLPQHPERKGEAANNSLPKASQPNRESRKTTLVQSRRSVENMIPGTPARNLGMPSTVEEAAEAEAEGGEEEGAPGLLGFIPHEIRGGGIAFEAIYTGETFTKNRGGLIPQRSTNYRSNMDLVLTADTGKLGWWDRGRLFVYGQNLTGRPLSATDVGDTQLFSNIDSTISDGERPNFTTVAEYWYEQYLLEDKFRFKLGKQDANVDFALSDLGGEFIHSSYGVPPMIPLPTFPSQSLGLAMFYQALDTLTLGVGVYDGVLPSGPSGVRWGFDTLGHNGVMSMYQAEFKPQLGPDGQLPTTIRTGMWHHSDKTVWTELTADPNPTVYSQNYGCFTTVDQMLFKESYDGTDDQGLGAFFQYGYAPGNRNFIENYVGGGLVYKGFLPGRDIDMIGLGFAKINYSGSYRDAELANGTVIGSSETAIETFYKCIVGPNVSLQPDMQYIANPGGQYKDVLLTGLRFEAIF